MCDIRRYSRKKPSGNALDMADTMDVFVSNVSSHSHVKIHIDNLRALSY